MSACYHHPKAEAVGFCRQCGKALCTDCKRDVQGMFYCEECLASNLAGGRAAAPAGRDPEAPNPALAAVLGCIPGVGAIYNGEYMKAVTFVLIFGLTIGVMDSGAANNLEPLLGIFLAAFIFYMIMDSYRVAKARTAGIEPAPQSGWEMPEWGGNGKAAPVGPVILIGLGGLFLLNNILPFHLHIFRFWPVALIALGAYLIWQRTGSDTR